MCGICGIVNFNGVSVEPEDVLNKTQTLVHRGPDDQGIYCHENVGLGSRRLSIIDLETGSQPIHNEDSSAWIVCNGEIYNYRSLRVDLKAKGHRFYTGSDTEVILHLYEEYQEKCVDYLNGIFAFAIWDRRRRKLLVARDRLGVKPLFYYQDKNKLIFASEIKAIISDPALERKLNKEALSHFFSFNYLPSPLTMFKGIQSLLPGYMLICSDGDIRISKYWELVFEPKLGLKEVEVAEQLLGHMRRAVKMQLASDVPLGAFLSGGMDSTAVVSLMRENFNQPFKTFNVSFQESSYDESSYAALAAKFFGTEHYEVLCRPKDYIKYLPEIIRHSDNLTVDISMLPLYLVSRLASQQVKVVLSGDGADELFAGYPTYRADRMAEFYCRLPSFIKQRLIPGIIEKLPVSERKMSFEFKAKRFIRGADSDSRKAHFSWRMIFSPWEKQLLFSPDFLNQELIDSAESYRTLYRDTDSWEELSRHQYADIKSWLPDSILAKVDFMSMASSLEVRVPYLDHELVEFAAAIPAGFKLKGSSGKHILKKAIKNKIPASILKRKKAGFNIPVGKWFRGSLKELLRDTLSKETIDRIGCFNRPYIEKLIQDHLDSKRDNGYKLLSLVHFCRWHDEFITRPMAST